MNVIIYGAGGTGRKILKNTGGYNVIAFVDTDTSKHGKIIDGIPCYSPADINNLEFDSIIIGAVSGFIEIQELLIEMGIPSSKIITDFVAEASDRIRFLGKYSDILKCTAEPRSFSENVCVAEAGVFRGEFAMQINKFFPDNRLYLFDTFEGFDERDLGFEDQKSLVEANHFKGTSEELVLGRMPFKDKCIIRKGWFPETANGIDEKFAFVSLDMDLYKPILEGLRFFYPRMIKFGCILIDDYYSESYPNVKKAVSDFSAENNNEIITVPICENCIAVIKPQ